MSLSESPMNGSSNEGADGSGANGSGTNGSAASTRQAVRRVERSSAARPMARPDPGRALTLPALLAALRRRWLLAAVLGTAAAAVAAFSVWVSVPPPKASARAMVHIAAHPDAILPGRVRDPGDFAHFQKTQMTVVKSQLVLNTALRNPQVARLDIIQRQSAPLEWLMQEIDADFSMGAELLRISMKGDDPEALKVIVNGVMKAYLEEFINHQETKRREHLAHLKKLREKHESDLKIARERVESFTPKLGTGDPKVLAVWHEIKLKELGAAKSELIGLQSKLSKAELELKGLEQLAETVRSDFAVSESEIERLLAADALYIKLLDRVAQLEDDIAAIRANASPEFADEVLKRNGKLTELDAALRIAERRKKELVPKIVEGLREKNRADLQAGITRARQEILLARETRNMFNKMINELASETEGRGKESFEMLRAQVDLDEEEKIVRAVDAEIRGEMLQLMAPSRARPLDDAVAVRASGLGRKLLMTAAAGVAAFALLLFLIAWSEWRSRRIHCAEDVAHGLGIRLVGTLPPVPQRRQNRLGDIAEPALPSCGTESIDTFRTFLLHAAAAHAVRSVMVTSAVAGEGKTSLACQLAISLARAGRKTLLIDSDLRRGSVHRRLGLAQGPGLAEVLRGEAGLGDVVQRTSSAGLAVLTAGKADLQAVQAMNQRIPEIIADAKGQFDFVLIDSAPLLSVADPLLIGQHVDGAILSTLRGVSRIPLAAAAQHRMAALGIPSLGAVVSGTREELYSFNEYQPAA